VPLAGSPETVARRLEEIGQIEGVAGIMLIFDDFVAGMERFGRDVMPLVTNESTVAVS
jgi:pyrimidine oxygenase